MKLLALACAACALLAACLDQAVPTSQCAPMVGRAFFATPTGGIQAAYALRGPYAVVGGDMLFPAPSTSSYRGSGVIGGTVWTNGVVPYAFATNLLPQQKQNAQAAIDLWNRLGAMTNVRWVPRRNEVDYVNFTSAEGGCFSMVGRSGGAQPLNLAADCEPIAAPHEAGHAMGLGHEHQRPDRDQYIDMHYENMPADGGPNWDVIAEEKGTTAYDIHSIMHYPASLGSTTGRPIMTPKDRTVALGTVGESGPHGGITDLDITGLASIYRGSGAPPPGAPGSTPPTPTPPAPPTSGHSLSPRSGCTI